MKTFPVNKIEGSEKGNDRHYKIEIHRKERKCIVWKCRKAKKEGKGGTVEKEDSEECTFDGKAMEQHSVMRLAIKGENVGGQSQLLKALSLQVKEFSCGI